MSRRPVEGRTLLVAGTQLLGLTSLALGQPLLDLLGRSPEFFVARGSTASDIVVFALGVVLVPAAVLLLVEALVGLADARAGAALHLLLVGLLAAAALLVPLVRIEGAPALVILLAAALGGAAVVAAYLRLAPVRSFLTALGLAPLLFLGLFFLSSPSGSLALERGGGGPADVGVRRPAPVVMIVFDEFPTLSLLDGEGGLDATRFPGFAELARNSTWYRNATTVDSSTSRAVPAILTGRYPTGPPIFSAQPENLFTLLGGTYDIEAAEAVTRLCPPSLCPPASAAEPLSTRMRSLASDLEVVYLHVLLPQTLRNRLPSISGLWGGFGGGGEEGAKPRIARGDVGHGYLLRRLLPGSVRDREASFELFRESLGERDRPTLFFLHVLLPHYPWEHTASGRTYPNAFAIPGLSPEEVWTADPFLVEQAWQRHILQVGYVDRLVGELVARLRATDLYDRSLVVLVADHGVSFVPGTPRKHVTKENAEGLAFVPLFVKEPHQFEGRIADETVPTIDVLPTVADILGIRIPWRVDGRSLAAGAQERRTIRIGGPGNMLVFDSASLRRGRDELLSRQTRLFGTGAWRGAFRIDRQSALVGRRLARLGLDETPGARIELDRAETGWRANGDTVPAFVRGVVSGPGAGAVERVAVAVNGTVVAIVPTYRREGKQSFSALVPESAFRRGENGVRAVPLSGGAP